MTDATATQGKGPLVVGRYAVFDALASGGMATVHLGRVLGSSGGRIVAIKRLHAHFAGDPEFVAMFTDEARIVSRIVHANVVPMIDVVESNEGLLLVMDYVHGESLSKLLRASIAAKAPLPLGVVTSILHGALLGLHGAHETRGPSGELLDVVHRDVSPQNVIVGVDGVARVLDFGVAKASGRSQVTREGQLKGKLTYMAPEQIRGKADRRADVFSASVILWESLTGRRMHEGASQVEIVARVMKGRFTRPSAHRAGISSELDAIVLRGLEIDPQKRYASALAMATDLERLVGPAALAPARVVAEWVERLARDALRERAAQVAAMEMASLALAPRASRESHAGRSRSPEPTSPSPRSLGTQSGAPTASSPRSGAAMSDRPDRMFPESSPSIRTPLGTEVHVRAASPMAALLVVSVVFALVGVVLGAYSLLARGTRRPDPSLVAAGSTSPPPLFVVSAGDASAARTSDAGARATGGGKR